MFSDFAKSHCFVFLILTFWGDILSLKLFPLFKSADGWGGTYSRIRPWGEGAYCRIQSREDGATSEDRISERGLHRRTGSPGVGGEHTSGSVFYVVQIA
jgi:hypothetical protein